MSNILEQLQYSELGNSMVGTSQNSLAFLDRSTLMVCYPFWQASSTTDRTFDQRCRWKVFPFVEGSLNVLANVR